MKKSALVSIITAVLLSGWACSGDPAESGPEVTGATLRLSPQGFSATRLVDADNLAVEQTINNITVLLTDPSSLAVTDHYIDVGFSDEGDYRLVTLPGDPADFGTKDIYVVTNYSGGTDLSTVTSIDMLNRIETPGVTKSDYLDPADGFCMYGSLAGFDFTSGTTADVYVKRTCAKLRVNLTFPDDPGLSTDNSFLIANVASHTYIRDVGANPILVAGDYFNFAAELPLTDDGSGTFTAVTYVYEATQAPVLYIYTHLGGTATAQEFSAALPLPVRNYLYDLDVRIYEDTSARSAGRYVMEITVREDNP